VLQLPASEVTAKLGRGKRSAASCAVRRLKEGGAAQLGRAASGKTARTLQGFAILHR
jgi:hypothetical protein